MWFVIVILLLLMWVVATGAGEPPVAKITRLLKHYKLDATKYLQRKFGVQGTGKTLVKRICDKFLIDSLEKFISVSGLSQKALLPADKVLFLEDSKYVPTELEYEILKKLFPDADVYELWRKNPHIKIRDNLVRAPMAKIKKAREALEIDILPFYGMMKKVVHDKELSVLEKLLKQADRERRARILLAIIRNRDFAKYGLSSIWLDHLKDIEYLIGTQAKKASEQAEEEKRIDNTVDEQVREIIENEKKSKELSEYDKAVVDSLADIITPTELESLTDEINNSQKDDELTEEERKFINEDLEQEEKINREKEEEELNRVINESSYPTETYNYSMSPEEQRDVITATQNSLVTEETDKFPPNERDAFNEGLVTYYASGEAKKTFNTYKKYL